jgi:hypothetical protein
VRASGARPTQRRRPRCNRSLKTQQRTENERRGRRNSRRAE